MLSDIMLSAMLGLGVAFFIAMLNVIVFNN